MNPRALMVQGTSSDAGKSLLVTALCRWLAREGYSVAPFKPQNMALNSAVTADGGEIGRAQAAQSYACGLEPHTDMNPVLLKPNTDTGAQVIIQGHAIGNLDARHRRQYKTMARKAVLESFARLSSRFDRVIVEGAGSPAEINLRENDIANMGFAESVDCPVILVADIDRGGVFAHLVGTLALLSESEKKRIIGFVINRFRGDLDLLQPGLDWLEKHTAKPVLGVLPFLQGLHLEAEDALPRERILHHRNPCLKIIVPALPRISNHTDFDPLTQHPQIEFSYIGPDQPIPDADLVILPGSKSVQADLEWLRSRGWQTEIFRHLRYGGKLIGICGGFQMLGKYIHDPLEIEGRYGTLEGLGLFDMETTLQGEKQLRNVHGKLTLNGMAVSGYEIHAGNTWGPALDRPLVELDQAWDGARSVDDLILGTYLHGIFESTATTEAILSWAGLGNADSIDYQGLRESNFDRLADAVETHLDTEFILSMLNLPEVVD